MAEHEPADLAGPERAADDLLGQLIAQAQEGLTAQGKMRALLNANRSIVADLGLSSVLERIVEAACQLVGAPYGALGVVDPSGVGLSQFIHVGMDDTTVRTIGHLPQGKGVLGALIEDPRPIRLRAIGDDPRSSGFPSGHPEMKGFLGVPVRVRNEVYGNLYLASPEEGNFTREDEELVSALAATAGVAIDNAKLFEESTRWQEWLEATTDTTRRVLFLPAEEALRVIGQRVAELAEADVVAVALPGTENPATFHVTVAVGLESERLIGFSYAGSGSVSDEVVRTGVAQVFADAQSLNHPRIMVATAVSVGPAMVLPLTGATRVQGVLVVGRRPDGIPFADSDMAMATNFAHHASLALELAEARREAQRALLIEERARIARDLHDQVIQQLFVAGMALQGIVKGRGDDVTAPVNEVVDQIDDAIRQIRTYIFHLRAGPEAAGGLRAAVLGVCSEVIPVLGFAPRVQFLGPVDTVADTELAADVAAVVRESLSNVARHAAARAATVVVTCSQGVLQVQVDDDGRGPGRSSRRSGRSNLEERAARRHGSYSVDSRGDAPGTHVAWSVPIGPPEAS